jgi:hypothetical protein
MAADALARLIEARRAGDVEAFRAALDPAHRLVARRRARAYERARAAGTLDPWAPGTALDGGWTVAFESERLTGPDGGWPGPGQVRRAEEVGDDLELLDGTNRLHTAVVETLCRLPVPVAAFALRACTFVGVGAGVYGAAFPGRTVHAPGRSDWLLVIDQGTPDKDLHSVIAHEIAHARRKDDFFPKPRRLTRAQHQAEEERIRRLMAGEPASPSSPLRESDEVEEVPPPIEEVEAATARLTASWGFTGRGARHSHHRRLERRGHRVH